MATILTNSTNSVEACSDTDVSWQRAMKRAIRDGIELCEKLQIDRSELNRAAEGEFPVFAPLEYIRRMSPGDPNDPLLLQVLPQAAESQSGGLLDPVDDLGNQRSSGLLQKYPGRVLLMNSTACAVHCRYCFRRHFPYSDVPVGIDSWTSSLDSFRHDESIREVILSGGDPLTSNDVMLGQLIDTINKMPHIRRLRIHTRFPVVIPQRVCETLLEWVQAARMAVYFVLHINHANEIDESLRVAVRQLAQKGVTVLNQAVLLRGINDQPSDQLALCEELINTQILPYYLHQLDPVQGALHYEVCDAEAQAIVNHLRSQLPGYAVPKLVREISGESSKTPV